LYDAETGFGAAELDSWGDEVAWAAAVGVDGPAHDSEERDGCDDDLDFEELLDFPGWDEVDDGEVQEDEEDEAYESWGCDAGAFW